MWLQLNLWETVDETTHIDTTFAGNSDLPRGSDLHFRIAPVVFVLFDELHPVTDFDLIVIVLQNLGIKVSVTSGLVSCAGMDVGVEDMGA